MRDRVRDGVLGFFKKRDGNAVTICCFLIIFWLCCSICDAGLIGYYPGNDKKGVVADIVGDPDLALLGKIETEGYNFTYEGAGADFDLIYSPVVDVTSGLNYTYSLVSLANKKNGDDIFMSGTVSYDGPLDVQYFTAKAGNGFNLYSWENDLDFQSWHTYNTCKELSHVSFYGGTASVPEPSSFFMLLGAAAVLLGYRTWKYGFEK